MRALSPRLLATFIAAFSALATPAQGFDQYRISIGGSSYELRGLHCEVDAGTFPAGASDPGLPASATIGSRPAASSEISRKLRQEVGKKKGEGRRQDDSKR